MSGFSDLALANGPGAFLSDGARSLTFDAVLEAAGSRAAQLDHPVGTVVAVTPTNTFESVVDCLAAWQRGCVLQLVNGRLTPAEVTPQLAATGAVWLGEASGATPPAVGPDTALIVATSGTGATPKLVELTWGNLIASADAANEHLEVTPNDRWLAVLPLFHVGGFSIITRALRRGNEVVLREGFDPGTTCDDLAEVTIASMVGTMLPPLLAGCTGPFPLLRAVLVGGSATRQDLLDAAASAGMPVLSTYGMTETASQIATAPLGDGPRRRAVALPGAEIRLAVNGEIEVRGPMVSPGYVGGTRRAPEAWMATGDLGTLDADGFLRVVGRLRDLIITGGENVMPGEVEAVLESIPGVREAAVFGVPEPAWGQSVAAAVVADLTSDEIESLARQRLAGYKIPRRWLVVSELPRNALGKVDRARLAEMVDR